MSAGSSAASGAAAGSAAGPWGAAIGAGVGLLQGALGASGERRRNALLAQGSREQSRAGMEASNVQSGFLDQLRRSRPDIPGMTANYRGAVAGGPRITGLPTASARFRGDVAGGNVQLGQYGDELSSLFARLNAPGQQRQREALAYDDMNTQQIPIRQRASSDQFITQLRADQAGRVNPWLQGGLQFAGNVAQNYDFRSGRSPATGGGSTGPKMMERIDG